MPQDKDLQTKRVITTSSGYRFHIWSDGYRLWAQQISDLPLNGKKEPECLFEWKHSDALCSGELSEAILQMAFTALEKVRDPIPPRPWKQRTLMIVDANDREVIHLGGNKKSSDDLVAIAGLIVEAVNAKP